MGYKSKEDQRAYQARWYKNNKGRIKKRVKKQRSESDYAAVRNDSFVRKYGITLAQRTALWESQGKRCAICQCALEERGRATHTDHDHQTGKVRGILCRLCNTGLGKLDTVGKLQAAIEYLQRHG